jgi:hypothetical protein
VRIVDIERGVLHARDEREFAQRRDVAVHAEDAVGREHRAASGTLRNWRKRAFGIQVRIAAQLAAARRAASMRLAWLRRSCTQSRRLRATPARHPRLARKPLPNSKRARHPQPVGEFAFERVVRCVVAAHQVRGDAARAVRRAPRPAAR